MLVGASSSSTGAVATDPAASGKASVVIRPGTIGPADLRRGAVQPRHLSAATMRTVNGAGPIVRRPRSLPGNAGWTWFATDVDGGALFRSNGAGWDQLTVGRLAGIPRGSIDAQRIMNASVTAPKLAVRSVTARAMSMDAWRQISSSGPLASRPEARTRPAGSLWLAPDADGGTLYFNDGVQWLTAGRATLTSGAVSTAAIVDGAVTRPKIAQEAWTEAIASGTLAQRPLSSAANAGFLYLATDADGGTLYRSNGAGWVQAASGVSNPISGAAGGVLAGSYPSPSFAAGVVDAAAVAPDAVGAGAIQTDAVGAAEIVADAVDSSEVAADAIGASEIAADAVDAAEIAAGAVGSDEIADGSIVIGDIAQSTWTSAIGTGTLAARAAAAPGNEGFLYQATDDAGGTLARSDGASWQVVGHTRTPRSIDFQAGTLTNMAVALTELIGVNRSRVPVDLTTHTEMRVFTNVAVIGHTTAVMCAQYSIDTGVSWYNFDGTLGMTSCVSGVGAVGINALGLRTSAWQSIPQVARVEGAIIRMVMVGGNAAVDPALSTTGVELR